jgi:hypothetical protein
MTEGFLSDQMLVVDVRERTEGSLGATTNGEGSMATAMQGSWIQGQWWLSMFTVHLLLSPLVHEMKSDATSDARDPRPATRRR